MYVSLFAELDWTNFIGLVCIPLTIYAMKWWGRWSENRSKRARETYDKGYDAAIADIAEKRQLDEQKQLAVDVATLKQIVKGELTDQSNDLKETSRVETGKVANTVESLSFQVKELVRSKDEVHTKLWEATHENHTATENLRHAVNDKLQVITNGIQILKDGQAELNKVFAEHVIEDRENFAKVLKQNGGGI